MEPVQQVLGLRIEVAGQLADVFAAVGEEGDPLVGLQPLGGKHFEQPPFGFAVVGLPYPKHDDRPSAGMALPAITSNQPSRRVRCVEEWT